MISAQNLTKRFGSTTAVDDITFDIRPGMVTGFLGPNGAGKSTTMRMIVGLDRPTAGAVTVGGSGFTTAPAPMTEVGALLDAKAVNRKRTARNHLRMIAATNSIPAARVDEVLGLTGIESVADKKVGGFSLGMHQRLGIAATMLGDPHTLILDEPVNGLDPEGVHWVRRFVRRMADEGRTVFLSSHLMSEMAQIADHVIVLGQGRVLANAPISDFTDRDLPRTRVRVSDAAALSSIAAEGVTLTQHDAHTVDVDGVEAAQLARAILALGLDLHELTPIRTSLEDAYLSLTGDAVEYRSDQQAA